MIVINTVSDKRFSLNGIEYVKNFLSFVAGDRLLIYNAYDRTDERCDLTLYSEFQINGVTYASAALVQSALINVIYSRSSLGGAIVSRFDELLDTFSYTGRNGHFVRVRGDATGLESVSSNVYTDSEKSIVAGMGSPFPKMQFAYVSGAYTFELGTNTLAKAVFWNGALLNDVDWSQSGTILTILFPLTVGDLIKPI